VILKYNPYQHLSFIRRLRVAVSTLGKIATLVLSCFKTATTLPRYVHPHSCDRSIHRLVGPRETAQIPKIKVAVVKYSTATRQRKMSTQSSAPISFSSSQHNHRLEYDRNTFRWKDWMHQIGANVDLLIELHCAIHELAGQSHCTPST
jgi:hypothetical protein